MPFFFATIAAFTKLDEAPLVFPPPVDIKTNKSFFFPWANTCLSKKVSNPKSFPQAVIAADVPVIEKADTGGLFASLKVHWSSPVKCSASAQDPPFPATKILLSFLFVS